MKRREFIAGLGSAAAWPLAARAQQPVVGYVAAGGGNRDARLLEAFRRGLNELGYSDPNDVLIEQRVGRGQIEQLPAFVADLVKQRVSIIAALSSAAAHAAKAATSEIPIIFLVGTDPVKTGLVASYNRPGRNMTGIMFFTSDLEAKRIGLLHEMVPHIERIAVLLDPPMRPLHSN
jgi:putative ABC transport system substrate-binding protein